MEKHNLNPPPTIILKIINSYNFFCKTVSTFNVC